ncbi:unnamed protein product [Orchesella dallaii]|uniref:CARD domain-containing protein n=1 Tax=Orchesella dallaii TaxID=48710 RepID=A0ABP1SA00_9HEXA
MEEWQKEVITTNQNALIELTNCNISVITKLQQQLVLSEEEANDLNSIPHEYQRKFKFYNILKTRQGAYEILLRVLHSTNQSGAAQILQQHHVVKPLEQTTNTIWQKGISEVGAYLSINLVISTIDRKLTKEKIETAARQDSYQLCISESNEDDETHHVTTMKTIVGSSIDRTIRIVHVDYIKQLEDELKRKNESYKIIEDNYSWKNLTGEIQHELLERTVKFQEIEMSLQRFCENFHEYTKMSKEHLLKKLKGKLLVDLINYKEPPTISNGNVPPIPTNYVPRSLQSRSHISRKILNITKAKGKSEVENDILLFFGLELYELTGLVEKYGNGVCSRSSDYEIVNKDRISCQAFLVEATESNYDAEFERICKLTEKPVHIFNCIIERDQENKVKELEWKKSRGSVKTLHKFMHTQQECINEEKFMDDKSMTSFCIAELPGNGKTTLMAKCTQMLIDKKRQNFYTQYIVFSEFIKELIGDRDPTMKFALKEGREPHNSELNDPEPNNSQPNSSKTNNSNLTQIPTERIFQVLSATSCQSTFGQSYVTAFVKKYGVNCDYIFDGLDELPQNQLELAMSIVKFLRRVHKKYIRVWVTTRPDLLVSLEEGLGVLGRTINPFEEVDQIKILTTYWCNNEDQKEENNAGLREFAKHCLEDLKAEMSNDEKDIAGIPLLCLLIAEVYQDEALEYSHSNQNQDSIQQTHFKVNITKLCEKYIEKRFQNSNVPKVDLENAHMALAIQLLLPNNAKQIIETIFQSSNSVSKKDLLNLGIIQADSGNPSGTPRFIHKTIAEYFVALSFYNIFQQITNETVISDSEPERSEELMTPFIILCRRVLDVQDSSVALSSRPINSIETKSFKFAHPNICHFLNLMIQTSLHFATTKCIILSYSTRMGGEILKKKLWKCLHAAVISNLTQIVDSLIRCLNILLPNPDQKIKFCNEVGSELEASFKSLLFFAAKYGSATLMHNVRKLFEEWTTDSAIKQELKETHLPFQEGNVLTLLHVAVEEGNYPVVNYLLNKMGYHSQICEEKYKDLIQLCLLKSNNDTEVKIENKIKIINLLMKEQRASYLHPDFIADSILTLMIEPVSLKLLFSLLTHMKKPDSPIAIVKTSDQKTLLHLLPTKYYDARMTPEKYHEHLEYIQGLFNLEELLMGKDDHDLTAVDWAVTSLDILDKTLDIFNGCIKENDIIVKAIAGQRSAEFLQRLINKGFPWDGVFLGKTVLHFAAEKYNYEATELFTSPPYNIDVNSEDNNGNTPLHLCLQKRGNKKSRLKSMSINQESTDRSESSDSNSLDTGGVTNMISGVVEPNNQHRIIEHLIENGAKIEQPNKHGKTPLHFAIDICGGLTKTDLENLKRREQLFKNESLALAYIGIILNPKIGTVWHPNVLTPFANALRKLGACAREYKENGTPLLHLAAKRHSMGVKYLLEHGLADANSRNNAGKTALEYMGCDEECTAYTCRTIKNELRNAQRRGRGSIIMDDAALVALLDLNKSNINTS